MEALWVLIIFMLVLGVGFLYLRNIFCLVSLLRESKFSLILGCRAIGVFFPVVGIIMGLV